MTTDAPLSVFEQLGLPDTSLARDACAAAFLRERGADERRIAIAWDAVALHTSDGIAPRKATEVALAEAGIGTDILGARRESLPAGLAARCTPRSRARTWPTRSATPSAPRPGPSPTRRPR